VPVYDAGADPWETSATKRKSDSYEKPIAIRRGEERESFKDEARATLAFVGILTSHLPRCRLSRQEEMATPRIWVTKIKRLSDVWWTGRKPAPKERGRPKCSCCTQSIPKASGRDGVKAGSAERGERKPIDPIMLRDRCRALGKEKKTASRRVQLGKANVAATVQRSRGARRTDERLPPDPQRSTALRIRGGGKKNGIKSGRLNVPVRKRKRIPVSGGERRLTNEFRLTKGGGRASAEKRILQKYGEEILGLRKGFC